MHLHSRYSRAVSPKMIVPEIAFWAKRKGIDLVGTADWTHPSWLKELKENLKPAEGGLFSFDQEPEILFLLATEIASIYSQGGRTRRIHNLVLVPGFQTAEKIIKVLKKQGANLSSDGRPIVGLSAQNLVDLVLAIDKSCLVIPCHIWTPWFSLYGSRSGFDSIRECFGSSAQYIYGIETGLSSDPAMNWPVGELKNRAILSFSDAHSLTKLGREVTVFKTRSAIINAHDGKQGSFPLSRLTYSDIAGAIRNNPAGRFEIGYTVEFYPQEGKYHWTGHRHCGIKQPPEETKRRGVICPVCGRKLTVGVMDRVRQLADQDQMDMDRKAIGKTGLNWIRGGSRPPYVMMVPLPEILAEVLESGIASQVVQREYERLIADFDNELDVLLKIPVKEIAGTSGEKIAMGIKKVREGEVFIDPGFDGEFGKVKIWSEAKKTALGRKQMSLFSG